MAFLQNIAMLHLVTTTSFATTITNDSFLFSQNDFNCLKMTDIYLVEQLKYATFNGIFDLSMSQHSCART